MAKALTRHEASNSQPPQTTQPKRLSKRITRRELLAVAGATSAVAAVSLVGCAPLFGKTSPAPTATPFVLRRPASLYADATIPSSLASSLIDHLAHTAGIASVTSATSLSTQPDLVLTFGALPSGYSGVAVGPSAYSAFTHLRVPIENVTAAQARGLLDGSITDWQSVGAPYSLPTVPLWLKGLPVPQGVTLAQGATTYDTLADLLDALRKQPGSMTLLPVEAADWILHNLGVDGVFPAHGATTVSGLGSLSLWLGVAQRLIRQGLDTHALAKPLAAALASGTTTVDMIAVGDIMLGRGVNNQMLAHNDYLYPYRRIHDELMTADFRVANLECMITDLVPPPTDPSTFTFISAKKAVDGLVYGGFDVLTLANNHSNGEGQTVFQDMQNTLRDNNILHCGGGDNLAEATMPAIKTVKGVRIAILSYDNILPQGPFATANSWGLAPIDVNTLPQDIAAAQAKADLVIPYFHWGIEYTKDPTQYQQQVARAAIDAGAAMVLGNHPHWTQGIENYKGKLIIYSMGNFVFDQDWSEATEEGMLLHLYWRGGRLVSVRFVATLDVNRCQPRVMSPGEAINDFARMWTGTDMLASGEYGPEPEP